MPDSLNFNIAFSIKININWTPACLCSAAHMCKDLENDLKLLASHDARIQKVLSE